PTGDGAPDRVGQADHGRHQGSGKDSAFAGQEGRQLMTAMLALHLWQSTVVLLAAWLLTLICRRNAAEVRYGIWLCASLKFLVPFAVLQRLGDYVGQSLPMPLALDPVLIETGSAIVVPSIGGVDFSEAGLPTLGIVAATLWALGAIVLSLRWFAQ